LSFEFSFEDKTLQKNCENVKVFSAKRLIKNFVQNFFLNDDGFLRKLQTTGSIERTAEAVNHGVLKMCCFTLGNVDTELG